MLADPSCPCGIRQRNKNDVVVENCAKKINLKNNKFPYNVCACKNGQIKPRNYVLFIYEGRRMQKIKNEHYKQKR